MKKRFFAFSYLAGWVSILVLLVMMSNFISHDSIWELVVRFLLPVSLFSLIVHVLAWFYFWNPYEKYLYHLLNLPESSFNHDLIDNIQDTWKKLEKENSQVLQEIEKLQLILNHMSEGVMIINKQGLIVHHNPSLEALLNFPIKIKHRFYWELIAHVQLKDDIRQSLENEKRANGEIAMTSPAEKILHFELVPLHNAHGENQLLIKLTDLTHIRKLERVRADFVANVSHELRSPLTAILGFTETLKEEKNLTQKQRDKFLAIVHDNVLRLSYIVEDLLILSKLEAGEQMDFSRFMPAVLIEEVLELYRQKITEKKHTVQLNIADKDQYMLADRYRLRQIMSNLLDNAIKYSHDNGSIIISQSFDEKHYYFSVEDTGMGIPYNDQARIFERFYRVDKSRTGDAPGTGLGLSIVKNIVESHQGTITLHSELGKGSRFSVVLPANFIKA